MKILFLVFIFSIFFFSNCNQKTERIKQNDKVLFFEPEELGAYNRTSNVTLEARFEECGEWGGHKEKIIIYADSTRNIRANYHVFPFNCDSLEFYYGNENLKPIKEKSISLNNQGKKSVIDYIQRLTRAKIAPRFPGHAGNLFFVVNSDSTLVIRVYDRQESTVNSYKRLVGELFE